MAAKKPDAAAGTADCYVLSRLDHNGVTYEAGESVALDTETGDALRAIGVVSRVQPVAEEPAPE